MIIGCRAVAWQLLFCPAAAVTYDDHSAEYHCCSKNFLPGKGIHADADADNDGDDRLDITVHAHQGRSDAFLTVGVRVPVGEEDLLGEGPSSSPTSRAMLPL